jgi:hypothetical protein
MRDARRRRVASRVRVLACVAPCVASWAPAAAGGGEGRLRSNAAVARMNLGILASLSEREKFSLSTFVT